MEYKPINKTTVLNIGDKVRIRDDKGIFKEYSVDNVLQGRYVLSGSGIPHYENSSIAATLSLEQLIDSGYEVLT